MNISKELLATVITAAIMLNSYQLSAMEENPMEKRQNSSGARRATDSPNDSSRYGSKDPFIPEARDARLAQRPLIYTKEELAIDLALSCERSDIERVQSILSNRTYSAYDLIIEQNLIGRNALHCAILGANLEIVRLIINATKEVIKDQALFAIKTTDIHDKPQTMLDFAREKLNVAKQNQDSSRENKLTNIINFLEDVSLDIEMRELLNRSSLKL